MDRARYEEYLRRFNARDYEGFFDFYGDHPRMDFFGVSLRSLDEVKRFYGFLHRYASERITLTRFAVSEELLAAEGIVRIEGLEDLTAETLAGAGYPQLMPIAKGQVIEMEQFLHYWLRDGKFQAVRCALA